MRIVGQVTAVVIGRSVTWEIAPMSETVPSLDEVMQQIARLRALVGSSRRPSQPLDPSASVTGLLGTPVQVAPVALGALRGPGPFGSRSDRGLGMQPYDGPLDHDFGPYQPGPSPRGWDEQPSGAGSLLGDPPSIDLDDSFQVAGPVTAPVEELGRTVDTVTAPVTATAKSLLTPAAQPKPSSDESPEAPKVDGAAIVRSATGLLGG